MVGKFSKFMRDFPKIGDVAAAGHSYAASHCSTRRCERPAMSSAVLTVAPVATPGRTTTGRWVIDSQRTTVAVHLRAFGQFASATGLIDIPDDITRSRVSVTVRSDSFHTGSTFRDRRAASARLLDAAVHPILSFSASGLQPIMESVVAADGGRPLWWLPGELTVREVTRPLRLALGVVRLNEDGTALEFGATTTLRRSDFSVTHMRALVSDVIDVVIRGRAHRQHTV
jgi:polyisoprenoid-binding protein YceI